MPSGPKKRMKLRRKKNQKDGSPSTDANSDRETEGMSISGSMDVDELDNDDADTPTPVKPGDHRSGAAFDDKDAASSQTEEWVRVSDFEVGTPTSQIGENDPSSEDADISSVRRSLDKLAEWESVSGDNMHGKRDGSINSLEEEPSEVEVEENTLEGTSGHSSESFTHLPSPQPIQEKDPDTDRTSVRSDSSSSSSGSSSSDAHSKPHIADFTDSTGVGPDSEPSKDLPGSYASVLKNEGDDEEKAKLNEDPVEKEVVHEGRESSSDEDTSPQDEREMEVDEAVKPEETEYQAADISEGQGKEEEAASDDFVTEVEPVSSTTGFASSEVDEQGDMTAVESISAASPVEEKVITTSAAKDINEVATPLGTPIEISDTTGESTEESHEEDKQVLPLTEEPTVLAGQEQLPGDDEKVWLEATFSGEKPTSPTTVDVLEDVPSEDKEVSSSSDDNHEESKDISSPDDKPEETKNISSSESKVAAVEEEEVPTSSAETEKLKKGSADVSSFESTTTIHEAKAPSGDHTELTVDTVSMKPLAPSSDQEEQQAVVVERHSSIDTNQPAAVKNGIVTGNLRPPTEQKTWSGCCDVIYWLLGREQ